MCIHKQNYLKIPKNTIYQDYLPRFAEIRVPSRYKHIKMLARLRFIFQLTPSVYAFVFWNHGIYLL